VVSATAKCRRKLDQSLDIDPLCHAKTPFSGKSPSTYLIAGKEKEKKIPAFIQRYTTWRWKTQERDCGEQRGDENAKDKQKHATQTQRTQSNARNNTQRRKGKEHH
jgi:hypothetical protein